MAKADTPNSGGAKSPADMAQMGSVMAAMLKSQAKMMDSVLRQNVEMLDFLKARFEKDRAMLAQLGAADDPTAALSVWSDFWAKAISDYSNEAGKMGALAAATTEQIIEGVTEEAETLASGTPKKTG